MVKNMIQGKEKRSSPSTSVAQPQEERTHDDKKTVEDAEREAMEQLDAVKQVMSGQGASGRTTEPDGSGLMCYAASEFADMRSLTFYFLLCETLVSQICAYQGPHSTTFVVTRGINILLNHGRV